jgi:hypothetical protein
MASTGDMNLDIAFSDHNMSKKTLAQFGEVVKAIHRVCDDDQLCFWTFIYYVSTQHSSILGVDMPPERKANCASILQQANPPPVVVEESDWGKLKREIEPRSPDGLPKVEPRKPWWKFW